MVMWIAVAVVGGLLSLAGFLALVRRYRRREIRGRYLAASGVGYVSFVSYTLLSTFRSSLTHGLVALAVLLPCFAGILVIVNEHRRRSPASSKP